MLKLYRTFQGGLFRALTAEFETILVGHVNLGLTSTYQLHEYNLPPNFLRVGNKISLGISLLRFQIQDIEVLRDFLSRSQISKKSKRRNHLTVAPW